MARRRDPRQLDLIEWLARQQPVVEQGNNERMREILEQYHASAVTGDADLQRDAVDRFRQLYGDVYSKVPAGVRHSHSDVMRQLFEGVTAPDDGQVLFGQPFKRIVDLGPCRALMQFDGFYTNGTSTFLRAVDDGPFISDTGFKACSSMNLAGYGDVHIHKLGGLDPLDWMIEAVKGDLSRDRKTGELKVTPWKPFDIRSVSGAAS